MDISELFLGSEIGQGAYSKVYEGIYHNKHVAVKILQVVQDQQKGHHHHHQIQATLEKEFNQEVKILSQIHHPNVVNYVTSNSENSVYMILTEFMVEGSLRAYLNRLERSRTRVPFSKVVALALEIARGMECVHSNGVIHRDLKPENVLIDQGFRLKVADFGVSCEEKNCDFENVGTLRWMAPELIKREKYNRKVDVYSFGLILCELVSGKVPFGKLEPIQVAYGVAHNDLRPEISDECPDFLRSLIQRCCCKDPKKRLEFSQIVKVLERSEMSLKIARRCGDQGSKKGLLHKFPKFCSSF